MRKSIQKGKINIKQVQAGSEIVQKEVSSEINKARNIKHHGVKRNKFTLHLHPQSTDEKQNEENEEKSSDSGESSDDNTIEEIEDYKQILDIVNKEEYDSESDDNDSKNKIDSNNYSGTDNIEEIEWMNTDAIIFVGNLHKETKQKQLKKYFSKYGQIKLIRLKRFPVGKEIKGLVKTKVQFEVIPYAAHIIFSNAQEAKAACQANGTLFKNLHLRVYRSNDKPNKIEASKSLFVGNLHYSADDEDLWTAFSPCGKIDSVCIVRDPITRKNQGSAFVNFESADSVQLAMQMGILVKDRVVRLKVYKPKKKERSVEHENTKIFIEKIYKCNEFDLRRALEPYGAIKKIWFVHHNSVPGVYIAFNSAASAQKALRDKVIKMNDETLRVTDPKLHRKGNLFSNKNLPSKKLKAGSTKGFQGLKGDKSRKKSKPMNGLLRKKNMMVKKVAPYGI